MGGEHATSWTALISLGAFHGINPAMGWLFAVALGLQERRRSAVLRALLPLALGHALAIFAVIALALVLGINVPLQYLRWVVAGLLMVVGVCFLFRHPHPRWVGMRVSMADLTFWSFLVASVHGAGLMILPVILGGAMHSGANAHFSASAALALAATAVHAASYLLVTALLAMLVFEKMGLGLLRKAWVNLDVVWAVALVATGAATLAA
jgi:hypothetical protein